MKDRRDGSYTKESDTERRSEESFTRFMIESLERTGVGMMDSIVVIRGQDDIKINIVIYGL